MLPLVFRESKDFLLLRIPCGSINQIGFPSQGHRSESALANGFWSWSLLLQDSQLFFLLFFSLILTLSAILVSVLFILFGAGYVAHLSHHKGKEERSEILKQNHKQGSTANTHLSSGISKVSNGTPKYKKRHIKPKRFRVTYPAFRMSWYIAKHCCTSCRDPYLLRALSRVLYVTYKAL